LKINYEVNGYKVTPTHKVALHQHIPPS